MMKNCRFFAWMLSLGLVLLIQACQLPLQVNRPGGEAAARTASGTVQPYSALVPSGKILRARVNEPLLLETYHMSRAGLDTLNVSVNKQPLPQENLSPQTPFFPRHLATVTFVVNGQEIRTGYLQPPYPTSTWTVPLIWTGHVPGTYDLVLQVTDKANQKGDITQRIEVIGP
jgi:hypothetical protein